MTQPEPQPLRALYSLGKLPGLDDFVARLEAELNWRPVYWITQPEIEDAVAARFPDAIRHDFREANRGTNDPVAADRRVPMDPALLTSDGYLLEQGLDIVARHVLGRTMSHAQQMAFLRARLAYAMGVVKGLDLQVFVLNSSPHCAADFAFYTAFSLLRRPVRILQLTGFQGLQVVLPGPEEAPLGLNALGDLGPGDLSESARTELDRLLQTAGTAVPWYVTAQKEREKKHAHRYEIADAVLAENRYPSGAVSFHAPVKRAAPQNAPAAPAVTAPSQGPRRPWYAALLGEKETDAPPPSDPAPMPAQPGSVPAFKLSTNPMHDLPMTRSFAYCGAGFTAPPITWKQYYCYRDWALLSKRRWFHDYARLTGGFDPGDLGTQPYVFFALHYQPERTTCPEGGLFADQVLAIRTIVEAIPEGWRVLVKEHPSQFLWQTEGELGRWDGYYDDLIALGSVELVPLEISSARLIQDAAAVVTVTGTVGWEACLAGVPAITLARPWYAGPGTVLTAHDAETMAAAFQHIRSGWRPCPDAIRTHLARLERVARRCYLTPSHGPLYKDMSGEDNIAALTDLFITTERLSQAVQ